MPMKNDSSFFSFSTPADSFFDSNKDGKLSGFETSMRDAWLLESQRQFFDSEKHKHDDDFIPYFDPGSKATIPENKYAWRENVPDSSILGIYPEDYETEEEFKEAVLDAAADQYGIDTSDFRLSDDTNYLVETITDDCFEKDCEERENMQRRANEQALLNKGVRFKEASDNLDFFGEGDEDSGRYHFILDNSDKITAANYLTSGGDFIFAKAIKDNFTLPCALPDEDNEQEMRLGDILAKLARYDIPLMLKVWEWCVDTFAPYAKYSENANEEMSDFVIDKLYKISDECLNSTVSYMNEHLEFCKKVMGLLSYSEDTAEYVVAAIKVGYDDAAKTIFETVLSDFSDDWKKENGFINEVINQCKDYYNECETMVYFRDKLFPLLDEVKDPMVREEFDVWKKEIEEYIDDIYDNCPKYAYLGKNSWRREVPHDKDMWADPCDYDSKEEYLEAYNEEKYEWRESQSEYEGIDPNDYETEEEFLTAVREKQKRELEERREKEAERRKNARKIVSEEPDFSKLYNVVGAVFDGSEKVYTYFCDDDSVKIGDKAIVMTRDGEAEVTIVSKGVCINTALPMSAKYIKTIKKAQ